jgi:hypothetical protein
MWQVLLDETLPLINSYWPWIEILKSWWHAIESGLLLVGLYWISRRLKSERIKINEVVSTLSERVETFGQFAKAARDAAETASVSAAMPSTGVASWEALRSEWFDIRDRIELAIERIDHKSVRSKYAKIDRRNYWDVIVTLREDGIVRAAAAAALINMNQRYMALRGRQASATPADLHLFREWVRDVNGALPKLPKSRAAPPTAMPVAAE